jgi:hypothetical protein
MILCGRTFPHENQIEFEFSVLRKFHMIVFAGQASPAVAHRV